MCAKSVAGNYFPNFVMRGHTRLRFGKRGNSCLPPILSSLSPIYSVCRAAMRYPVRARIFIPGLSTVTRIGRKVESVL
jgi:hypothetical protein